jgi:hypothetical protein
MKKARMARMMVTVSVFMDETIAWLRPFVNCLMIEWGLGNGRIRLPHRTGIGIEDWLVNVLDHFA